MSIIRTFHDKENPYTMLSNAVLTDLSLSHGARGLWAYCLSKPNHWEFHISKIIEESKEGKTATYRYINELVAAGYVMRIRLKKKYNNGKISFCGIEYIFFENKVTSKRKEEFAEEFKKRFPHSVFQDVQNEDAQNEDLGNEPLVNTDVLENTDVRNHHPQTPSNPEPDIPKPKPKQQSLRSDDDDFSEYEFLEGTNLSPKEKQLLRQSHKPDEIKRALKISERVKIRTTLMRTLKHILLNPDEYPDDAGIKSLTKNQQMALKYNEELAKLDPGTAEMNEKVIPQGFILLAVYSCNEIFYETFMIENEDFKNDLIRSANDVRSYHMELADQRRRERIIEERKGKTNVT